MTEDYGARIDAYLANRNDEATGRARTALTLAASGNADQAAAATRDGAALGVPAEVAQRNPEEVRRALYERQVEAFLAQRPELRGWMADNAPVVHDDLESVGMVGQAVDGLKGLGQGAVGDFAGGSLRGLAALNSSVARLMVRGIRAAGGDAAANALEAPVLPWWLAPSEILRRHGQMAVDAGEAIGPGRDTTGAQLGRGLGQVAGQIGLALATGGAGSALSWTTMAGQGGDQMAEFAKSKGAEGTVGGDIGALAGAAITGATERWGVGKLLEALPPTIKGTFARYLANIGVRAVSEGSQEMAEQFGQNAAAKALFAPDQDLLDGVGDSGKIGAGVGGIVGAILGITPAHRRVIEADASALDAEDRAAALKRAMAAVDGSKLATRDPAKAAELIQQIAGENGAVYVPARELAELFQSGAIPAAEAERLASEWGVADQFEQALISGGDLVVETGRFMSSATARAHADALVAHVRLGAGEMTAAEAKAWREGDRQAAIDAEAERAAIEAESRGGADGVFERVYDMAVNAGATPEVARQQATLMREFYSTAGQKLGADPLALFSEDALKIEGPNAELARQVAGRDDLTLVIDRLKSGRTSEDAAARFPILSLLKAKGGVRLGTPLAGELGAMGITHKTFPGLFAEGRGVGDVDNLVASEHPVLADNLRPDANGYADRQAVLDAILAEWSGNPLRTTAEQDRAARLDEPVAQLREVLEAEGIDPATASDEDIRAALKRFESEVGGDMLGQSHPTHPTGGIDPVADLYGDELAPNDADLKTLRAAVRDFYDNDLRRAPQHSNALNANVQFTNAGRQKSLSFSGNPDKLKLFAAVRNIIREGRQVATALPDGHKSEPNTKAYHYLEADVTLEGRAMVAEVVIREDNNGNLFYDLQPVAGLRPEGGRYTKPRRQSHPEDKSGGTPGSVVGETHNQNITPNDDGFNLQIAQPDGAAGMRGSFSRLADTYGNPANLIRLTERADLSTFLHESGHFYLFKLIDFAFDSRAEGAARERLQADLQAALDFVGADVKVAESNAEAVHAALTREQHETWARGFEAYLMEGKAPSAALRDAFARFKAWLLNIYRSLKSLDVNLTPEVRGVFDRLLAADGAIAEAEAAERYAVSDVVRAALTPAEVADLERLSAKATDEAKTALERRVLDEMKRAETEAWRAERAAVRAQIEPEVRRRPVYAAMMLLMHGRHPDGAEANRVKLDRAALVEAFGEEVLGRLPGPKNGKRIAFGPHIYAKEGGVSHHLLASQYGYSSGDEFVRALIAAEDMFAVINRETDAVMRERHGDLMTDGSMERAALEAIHDDARGAFLAAELAAVARLGKRTVGPATVLRDAAKRTIGRMQAREAVKSGRFRQQERRAARDYEKALVARDTAAAVESKQRQLLAFYLHRESLRAADEVDRITADFRRFSKKATREAIGKAGADYLERIDGILDQYEIRGTTKTALDRREALRQWLAAKEAAGEPLPEIPQRVLDDAQVVNFRTLPMDDLRGVHDAVKSIAHVALNKNKMMRAREKKTLDALAAEIASAISANLRPRVTGLETNSRIERMKRYGRGLSGIFLNADSTLREIDGFEDLGVAYREIKGGIDQAISEKLIPRQHKEGQALFDIFSVYSKADRRKFWLPRIVSGTNLSLSHWGRLSVALNCGNADNRAALIESGKFSEGDVAAVLDSLDKRDWDFVQSVWDYLDHFWPEIQAKEKARKGVAPQKVEAIPVITRHGTYRGGYFTLVYDKNQSVFVSKDEAEEAARRALLGRSISSQTKRGHTKERVGSGGRPVLLDISVVHSHVNQVIYDLEVGDAISDAHRLLNHRSVVSAFEAAGHAEKWEALEIWLQDVAAGEIVSSNTLEGALRWLRTGFTMSKLAWNVGTALLQPVGILQTSVALGKRDTLAGVRALLSTRWWGKDNIFEMISEESPFMASRMETFNKDISDSVRQVRESLLSLYTPGNSADVIGSSFFYMIARMQMIVDAATWLGARTKGIRDFGGDIERATQFADRVVARAQGSGIFADRTAPERGTISRGVRQTELVRVWTALISYFVAKNNVAWERTKRTSFKNPAQVIVWAADMVMLYAVEAVLVGLIRGQFPDGEDDDEVSAAGYAAKEALNSLLAGMPFVREFASEASGFRGGGVVGSAANEFGVLVRQIGQGEIDAPLLKSANRLGGIFFKYPASQINKTGEAITRAMDGEEMSAVEYLMGPRYDR